MFPSSCCQLRGRPQLLPHLRLLAPLALNQLVRGRTTAPLPPSRSLVTASCPPPQLVPQLPTRPPQVCSTALPLMLLSL